MSYVRYLDSYPTGRRRAFLLTMAVLASLITSYEAAIAPVVPLLLDDLQMTLPTYGAISAAAAIAGAVSGILAGRMTDKVGRVKLLVPAMLITALLCFAMTLVTTPGELLVVRCVLSFVDGIAIACTAPLVRDFSPRMGRATAFGFWTWGPVGANFLSAAIAAATLNLFGNWQSQFVIMGAVSLVVSIVIAANIAELSPALKATIRQTELTAVGKATESREPRMADLLRSRCIWAHVLGISSWLVIYITLLVFGQTMLVATFGVTPAEASQIMTAFWILDIVVLIAAGRYSDRLQLRRPFAAVGTALALVVLGVLIWMTGNPESTSTIGLMITGMLLGGSLALAYAPWMANFSENAEDIDPRLQGTAWGLFAFVTKVIAVVVLLVAPLVVASVGWSGWLIVSLVCLAAFGIAILFFEGPWRRSQLAGTAAGDAVLAPTASAD
ncbi:MFS transporter [Pseudonocardia humida]|uniref:MFS transporter n=1 Tax=Pseudonocardia humida TaxID=2800819 RepID=A0ABT0ZSP4_9PSEU|nr:MFS transporter [Pseudonocardia humida]MCO1653751.1 MFS transporter [Pseudonocardia humida]